MNIILIYIIIRIKHSKFFNYFINLNFIYLNKESKNIVCILFNSYRARFNPNVNRVLRI